jgi:hypothetical protein
MVKTRRRSYSGDHLCTLAEPPMAGLHPVHPEDQEQEENPAQVCNRALPIDASRLPVFKGDHS